MELYIITATDRQWIRPQTGRMPQRDEHESPNRNHTLKSVHVNVDDAEWSSAVPFYGAAAVYEGEHIIRLKILSDRRHEGGGMSWIVRFTPPVGKLIKIIATAVSDEHVLVLEGGRSTKGARPSKRAGGYSLNAKGQPHSAMMSADMTAFVVYAGEPDRVQSIEVIDIR